MVRGFLKVNEELGIIENSANMDNKYTVVEETKNDTLKVVTPTTTEQSITNNSATEYSFSDEFVYETSLEETETQEREMENIYYIDDYTREIYNSNAEVIGTIGQEYIVDQNNQLLKGNEVLGYVENLRDMPQEKSKTNSNAKKRILEKPNGYVSFMLITIGISLIFLISLSILTITTCFELVSLIEKSTCLTRSSV